MMKKHRICLLALVVICFSLLLGATMSASAASQNITIEIIQISGNTKRGDVQLSYNVYVDGKRYTGTQKQLDAIWTVGTGKDKYTAAGTTYTSNKNERTSTYQVQVTGVIYIDGKPVSVSAKDSHKITREPRDYRAIDYVPAKKATGAIAMYVVPLRLDANGPKIESATAEALSGGRITLEAVASGGPNLLYHWQMVDEDGYWTNIPGAYCSVITLNGFEADTEYMFRITVQDRNTMGVSYGQPILVTAK